MAQNAANDSPSLGPDSESGFQSEGRGEGGRPACRYNSDAGAWLRPVAGFACAGAASMRIYAVRSVI
jgi:hypothetical protein